MSYALEQLGSLQAFRQASSLKIKVIAPQENELMFDGLADEVVAVAGRSAVLRHLAEQVLVFLHSGTVDVTVCPGSFAMVACRSPQVVILQNANYVGAGPTMAHNRSLLRRAKIALARASWSHADLLVAISDSLLTSARSDRRLSGAVRSRFVLLRSGADRPAMEQIDEHARVAPPSLPDVYALSVANNYPHKRLEHLAEAWSGLFKSHEGVPPLVLVGSNTEVIVRGRPGVVALGQISSAPVVSGLMRCAKLLVSVSSLEAFPLTPVEALSIGCPVVLSDIPPHREVAGDAAVFVQDISTAALSKALQEVNAADGSRWSLPALESWAQHGRLLHDLFESASTQPPS